MFINRKIYINTCLLIEKGICLTGNVYFIEIGYFIKS